jgi:uncharacterized membrane protein
MHHRDFTKQLDEKAVTAAIARAESKSSAQARVFISHHAVDNALKEAQRHFHELGMEKTRDRNAVLVFVAPASRKFAIFGDVAIDQKCGSEFWETVRDEIIPHLKAGKFTKAIVHAVDRVGEKLAEHFPPRSKLENELSDEIGHD